MAYIMLGGVLNSIHSLTHKYVCITTYQPDTESNPNWAVLNEQPRNSEHHLNIITYPTYPDKFVRDMLHRLCDWLEH